MDDRRLADVHAATVSRVSGHPMRIADMLQAGAVELAVNTSEPATHQGKWLWLTIG
jgi:hypothetical protein